MTRSLKSVWIVLGVVVFAVACGGSSAKSDAGNDDAFDWESETDLPGDTQDVAGDVAKSDDVADVPTDTPPDGAPDVLYDVPADVPTDVLVDIPADVTSQPPLAGELVVTELMAKSQGGTDEGEWIEVTNVTDKTLDLTGCVLADEGSEAHTIDANLAVGPGAVLLLAKSADPTLNHGLSPDYVYAGFTLSNGGDEIVLRCPADGGDVLIDRVAYVSTQVTTGVALQLDPGATDASANDDAGAWCNAIVSYGAGVFGTPGEINPACGGGASVDWCRFQAPLDLTTGAGTTFVAYGHVFVAGVTDATSGVDGHPLLTGQAGYGPNGSDPATGGWTWRTAGPNPGWDAAASGEPGNDEYMASVTAPSPGTYDTAYRFSFDGGTTWTYCDGTAGAGQDGSEDGYSPDHAGNLVTEPSPCDPNPCTSAPDASCGVDGLTLTTYASPGLCAVSNEAAACDYPPVALDCSEDGGLCQDGLCVSGPTSPNPAARGDVLITEFMAKSQAGSDPGEWIELFNATNQTLDLGGCVLHDNGTTDTHTIVGPLLVSKGGFLVLAKSADAVENHGVAPDYVYTKFALGNSGDAIILTCGGVDIDAVVYTTTWVVLGVSSQLDPVAFDTDANDVSDNWCPSKAAFGTDGLLGTPGLANEPCTPSGASCDPNPCVNPPAAACQDGATLVTHPTPGSCSMVDGFAECTYGDATEDCVSEGKVCSNGQCVVEGTATTPASAGDLVLTEFMPRSQAGSGDTGEWVEFYNATNGLLDLAGCMLKDDGTDAFTINAPLVVAPGQYVVLAASLDPTKNHGVTADMAWKTFTLTNSADEIVLKCGDVIIDRVAYGSTWVVLGTAIQLSASKIDATQNDAFENWCPASSGYGTDVPQLLGTPHAANKVCGDEPDPCAPNPCTTPPEATCDGSVLVTHGATGVCAIADGTASCTYDDVTTDCADEGGVCDDTASATCVVPGQGNQPKTAGAVLITEFMAKSQAGDDPGEWVEVSNTTGDILDLGGCLLKDDDQNLHTIAGVLTIQPGGRLVLARSSDPAVNHGLSVDYVYSNFTLVNSSDVIEIDCGGVMIDRVAYAAAWVTEGAATQLSPNAFDPAANDAREAWCTAWAPYGSDGKLGTPGGLNPPCDPCTPNPCSEPPVAACDGTGTKALSYPAMGTCSVVDHAAACTYPPNAVDCDAQLLVCQEGACVSSGDPCVPNPCRVAPAPTCEADGTTLRTYSLPGSCSLVGEAAQCTFPSTTADCSSTPGTICASGACVPAGTGNAPDTAGQVIVTEFMARSTTGTDTGEWVELLNTTAGSLDLGGCTLKDDGTDHHTFASPLLIGAGQRLLVAKSSDPVLNHGLSPHYVYSNFDLADGGDQIVLACGAMEIDRVAYDAGWVTLGAATSLDPAKTTVADNDLATSWCPATVPYGTTLLYGTPGLENPACPLPCDPNPCTAASAPECFLDGVTVVTYSSPATCSVVDGAASCGAYPFVTTDCSITGLVCLDGACVVPTAPTPTTAGQVIVTEFMAKSQSADDPGEWIELTNVTTGPLNLEGCVLRDNHTSDRHTIAGTLTVAAGESLVLARSADLAENHGLSTDYVYASFFLANSSDEIVLECNSVVIDQVAYVAAQVVQGVASQLDPGSFDATANDVPGNWCGATTPYGTEGLLGTPGTANTPCKAPVDPCVPNPCTTPPAATCLPDGVTRVTYETTAPCMVVMDQAQCDPYAETTYDCSADGKTCSAGVCVAAGATMPTTAGQVIVTEFMAKSVAGNADNFEWFEVTNLTDQTFDLGGCTLTDNGTNTHTIAGHLAMGPDAILLMVRTASATEYGKTPDYVYGTAYTLGNSGDEIILTCGGVVIDKVTYLTAAVTEAKSRQLSTTKFDATLNDSAANWCLAKSAYNATPKYGTPGAANFDCAAP